MSDGGGAEAWSYDGRRVEKANGTLYWYGPQGEELLTTDLAGNNATEYVYFSGKRMARRDPSGTIYYYLSDHLDSARGITDSTGHIQWESDFEPFGTERSITNNVATIYKFTGKEGRGIRQRLFWRQASRRRHGALHESRSYGRTLRRPTNP
jgi:hypothetical protein